MVVGASGSGRTTFVNTLCDKQVIEHREPDTTVTGVQIRPITVDLEEEDIKINLTIVDTPGFGDSIDNESSFNDILRYTEKQYDDILAEESRIKRNRKFRDSRIHALLYFIAPTGHGLRELDIELMRRLGPRVNVIPVIGKADSFTRKELTDFKRRVMEDIDHYKIPIYNFPYDDEEDDDDTVEENCELRSLLPFAIIGSEETTDTDEGPVRVRRYPWGTAHVENPNHCDFAKLRYALLSTHLTDLKEITHDFLYENYRTEKLSLGAEDEETEDEEEEDETTSQVRIKEEHLQAEEERLREKELRVQREISEKRQELLAKEEALRSLEARLTKT
ncbi:Septin-domain-containing protein [Syncephalis fuscata]|nr:Septin-domain-containing protein [Syncephalis fuscata]